MLGSTYVRMPVCQVTNANVLFVIDASTKLALAMLAHEGGVVDGERVRRKKQRRITSPT